MLFSAAFMALKYTKHNFFCNLLWQLKSDIFKRFIVPQSNKPAMYFNFCLAQPPTSNALLDVLNLFLLFP